MLNCLAGVLFATATTGTQLPSWVFTSFVSVALAVVGWFISSLHRSNKEVRDYVKEQNHLQNKQINRIEKKVDSNMTTYENKLTIQKEEFQKNMERLESKLDDKASSSEVNRIYDMLDTMQAKLDRLLEK